MLLRVQGLKHVFAKAGDGVGRENRLRESFAKEDAKGLHFFAKVGQIPEREF